MTRSVFDPVVDPGNLNPNFFEGRLLTADSLRDDQKSHRVRQRLVARAVGAGVVEGLWVTRASTSGTVQKTVNISKGFAINRMGEILQLESDVTVDIIPPTTVPEPAVAHFARCEDLPAPQQVPTGIGIYLLVVCPYSTYRDRAPKSGLGSEGKIVGCGDRYVADGVQFRLEPLTPELLAAGDPPLQAELAALLNQTANSKQRSLLRNLVAHACFGTRERAGFAVDPFAKQDGRAALLDYGALDRLRELERLTDCDVPLALLLWNATSGIAFVDGWSVRRRPVPPAVSRDLPTLAGERSPAEAEARLFQFQEHLSELVQSEPAPTGIRAAQYFRYLPPAGMLPLTHISRRGLALPNFFAGRTQRAPFHIEGARQHMLLNMALAHNPIDLDENVVVWLYLVRENRQQQRAAIAIFSSGHSLFLGDARFDVNRWDFSNYGSLLIS